MTIAFLNSKIIYSGNGLTTLFAITFPFTSSSEIEVYLRDESVAIPTETLQVNPANYTVVGTDVSMVIAPPATAELMIRRATAKTQSLDLIDGGPFEGEAIETAFDKLTKVVQEVCEKSSRAILLPNATGLTDLLWPEFTGNENKIVGINASGTALEATSVDLTSLQAQITANTNNITTNTGNISTNTTNIATNVTNIATNVTDIATNAAAILVNTGNITTNTTNIATNVAAISALDTRVTALEAGTDVTGFNGIQGVQNGVAVGIDLVELAFDGDDYSSVIIDYEIIRSSDAPASIFTHGILYARFKDGVWEVEEGLTTGDASGLAFSIATDGMNVGRIAYTSNNIGGTANSYEGCIQYKVSRFAQSMTNSQAIDNGVAPGTPTAIPLLSWDGVAFSSCIIDYEIERNTATEKRFTTGILYVRYKDMVWEVERGLSVGDADGVTFSFSQALTVGTLQYSTDAQAGAGYVGELKWDFKCFLQPTSVD